MTSIEFNKKCKELNKQYKDIFGYVPCPADYVASVSQDEYYFGREKTHQTGEQVQSFQYHPEIVLS